MTTPSIQSAYSMGSGITPTMPMFLASVDPNSNNNNFKIGQFWLNQTGPKLWYLNSFSSSGGVLQASWSLIEQASAALDTLTGDSGGSVSPVSNNINISGGTTGLTFVGSSGTLTLTGGPYVRLVDTTGDQTITGGYSLIVGDAGNLQAAEGNLLAGSDGFRGHVFVFPPTSGMGYMEIAAADSAAQYQGLIINTSLSASRTWTFPDATGTVALTSQIPSLPISLANGGTNASLTANNGGIFYSTATAGAILSGTATARQMLQSGATGAPSWSAATWPSSTTQSNILYSSANNVVGEIASIANGVLITDNSSVPSLLTNGTAGYVLTAQSGAPPAWAANTASLVIHTNGSDAISSAGALTFTTVPAAGGASFLFTGSGSTVTLSLADSKGNVLLGPGSGSTAGVSGSDNVALGVQCLDSSNPISGDANIAIGLACLGSTSTGAGGRNVYIGSNCAGVVTGGYNIGIGYLNQNSLTSGVRNITMGYQSGNNYTSSESDNILLSSPGTVADSNTLRIGETTGGGTRGISRAFICGIYGITTASGTTSAVLASNGDQLGTISSSARFKRDISDMGDVSSRIMQMRPVTFHYKSHTDNILQYGLIAEEVYEIMPEIVNLDNEGLPMSVRYHDFTCMLLNELQKLRKEIEKLKGL
jgi:endosialidase-like protein